MKLPKEFVDMLNEMRFGRLTKKSIDKFHNLSREIIYEDGLGATELCVSYYASLWVIFLVATDC